MRRKSATIALLTSFSVYLIPLIGPHAAPLLGEMFFGDMYRSRPLWFLADLAAGLLLQLIAFTVLYLFLQKRNVQRGFVLGVAAPVMFVFAQALFMFWIPSIFLIENDTASDTGSWPVECTADDAWIVGVLDTAPRVGRVGVGSPDPDVEGGLWCPLHTRMHGYTARVA